MTRNQKITLGILITLALLYLLIPGVREWINTAVQTLTSEGLDGVVEYLQQYGKTAAVVSFFLMILQSIVSPIPAFVITLANAAIFGWWQGALLSWTSSMVGAALCFYIARGLGRDVVVSLTSERALQSLDGFFDKYGKWAIIVSRLLPFMSFDIVSYAAGLTSMGFWPFIIATGIGQAPATIVYSYVGQNFAGGAKGLFYGLIALFSISIIIFIVKEVWNDRNKKQKAD